MNTYKIHLPYIDSYGTLINAGIYEQGSFDLAEARYKSFVTLENASVEAVSTPVQTGTTLHFNPTQNTVVPLVIEAQVSTVVVPKLKINSCSKDELTSLKYVGTKTATEVLLKRKEALFTSIADLDNRVPLKGKSWEDITAIDFEEDTTPKVTTANSIFYA